MARLCSVIIAVGIAAGAMQLASAPPSRPTPSTLAVLDRASELHRQALAFYLAGKFDDALGPARQALAMREQTLGSAHPVVATSVNMLADIYSQQDAYAKAEPLYRRALEIREKALGPGHPDLAMTLNGLAAVYSEQGDYSKAESLHRRALEIRETTLGTMHPDVAETLTNLAHVHVWRGDYPLAEPLYLRALEIRKHAFGSLHTSVAESLNNLARLYRLQGKYAKAEPLLRRALDVYHLTLPPEHPDIATALNNLANVLADQGAYTSAEPLMLRALAIRKRTLGPAHRLFARSLNNLAYLYLNEHAYAKAEPLLCRALDIYRTALPPTHPDIATALSNLMVVYFEQGAYAKAEPIMRRALDISERTLGPTHPQVARSLNNLANLYIGQAEYASAEPLLIRALDVYQKSLGTMHREVAGALNNLGQLYYHQGAYDRAKLYLHRALDLRMKLLGPMHTEVANSLSHMAAIYERLGAPARAEALHRRALAIREQTLGADHPEVAQSLLGLAGLYWAQGAPGTAEPLLARAVEIQERQLRTELTRLPQSRKRALLRLMRASTNAVVSFHADAMPNSRSALELALTTVLRRKGRVLDSSIDSDARLRGHLTPALRDQLDQLVQARGQLVTLLYPPAGRTPDRSAAAATRAHIDELESALGVASNEFRAQTEPVTVAKIQAALPARTALAEFVRYDRFDPQHPQRLPEERYAVYIVTSRGPPGWIALGRADAIDADIDAVLAAMQRRVDTEVMTAALRRLDARILAPIRAHLPAVSHLIVAPDSKLNLVPFPALVDSEGHYALDSSLVSYVTAARDLLRLPSRPLASPAALFANPAYGPPPAHDRLAGAAFTPLAEAAAEAHDLRPYFQAPPVTGENATKSALAALRGPAVLHLATHGFYAADAGVPSPSAIGAPIAPARRGAPRAPSARDGERGLFVGGIAPPWIASPDTGDPAEGLDRAGVALAGANQGAEGIVTAREIAGFDWWGTQLVVLSACETGVGAVPSGDGVYGMRRALVLAGAASQVVSLWRVGDASTHLLMRELYRELARGTGRAEALRRAQLHVMHQPGHEPPYYWAAFIMAGEWRPLDHGALVPQ